MRLRFDTFVFDTERRELTHGAEPAHLTPNAFRLLEILVASRPKAISQEDLSDQIWPKTVVGKTALHNLISQLRKALDDDDHRVIRTAYGFGFSFGGEALEDDRDTAPTRCQVVVGHDAFELREGENLVGRDWDCRVRIESSSVSRHHARIIVDRDRVTIEDLGSKNGTTVEGRRVRESAPLSHGDLVVFGTVAGTFRVLQSQQSTETVL